MTAAQTNVLDPGSLHLADASLGLAATARASLACYSTRQEIDALVAGLGIVQEVFR